MACPPSSFTAWQPVSASARPQFRSASSREIWYVMKGMSQITSARAAPRATSFV